jgi:hypothetical protein
MSRSRTLLPLALLAPLAGLAGTSCRDAEAQGDADGFSQEELERLTAEIQADVERLRGESFPEPVAAAIATREEFLEYLQARIDAMETPESLAADEEVAKLLAVLPSDYDMMAEMLALVESQVGGFYDPSTKRFYLMEAFGGDMAKVILAHELTHALDDQIYGLDEGLEAIEGNTDAQWSYHAVVEGSGMDVMEAWTLDHVRELDRSALVESSSMGMDELADAPSYLWKPLVGTYSQGLKFLRAAPDELSDAEVTRRAFRAPPRSSEQVLHPEKYWSAEERDEPVPVAIDAAPPEGWSALDEDTLGELGLGLFIEPLDRRGGASSPLEVMSARLTWKAVKGWGGDRYVLLGRGDADRVLHLATTWDREKDAREFEDAVNELAEHVRASAADEIRVVRDGWRVHVTIARGAGVELLDVAPSWAHFGG